MKEVPKSTLPDKALDIEKCHKALKDTLKQPEPPNAFDRELWLANTKAQLKCHTSTNPASTA